MERVASVVNLSMACRRVQANKGSAGVDGETVDERSSWLKTHFHELRRELLAGTYPPSPVKGVRIPKPAGGERQLGIPTVRDRLVQQAILQQLEPLLDPTFSASSYGFRPGRSAHDALKAGSAFVEEGRAIVVDLDLEKFFDRVNHDLYVRTVKAGERVMMSAIHYLEGTLKLKVNRAKSAVAHVWARKFLGYRLLNGGGLGIAPKSLDGPGLCLPRYFQ